MSLEHLKHMLPDHARDLRINLNVIAGSTANLTAQQAWGTALTAAVTARNREVIDAIAGEAAPHLSTEAIDAARGAAAIMGMNNIYYRFLHVMDDPEYAQLPARLRMQIIGKPGVDQLDFELWSLAASAIAGCEACMRSHETAVRAKGGTREMVQDAVRIASVIHAVALTLDGGDAAAVARAA
jgi:alkyl hydroperoxide reductase subunit D